MTQPSLLDHAARTVAETSLDQWDRIKRYLPLKDLLMVAHVDDYLKAHARFGYTDVTGRELADWLRRDVLSVRPRLTECQKAGWLHTATPRKSRHPLEQTCAPYWLAVPRAAVERAIEAARESQKTAKLKRITE